MGLRTQARGSGDGRSTARGFTLVEVLVAVAIFALIGVVSAVLLTRTLDARERTVTRSDRLEDVQRAVQTLERDLFQFLDRGIRDGFGDPQPALRIVPGEGTEFTRAGWRNPLDFPRSELQRVAWRVDEDGRLVRRFWSVLDRSQDSAPREQVVLADVGAVEWTVIDADGGTWSAWPPEAGENPEAFLPGAEPVGDADPAALRFALEVAPFGRIERLVPIAVGEDVEDEDTDGDGFPEDAADEEDAAEDDDADAF